MTRLVKILSIAGLSSVYLMQGACTLGNNGFSIIPTFSWNDLITQIQGLVT